MADTKNQAQELISSLPVTEEVKQQLLSRLEAEGVTPELIVEMKMAMVDSKIELDSAHKEQLDKLAELDKKEEQEMTTAYNEYSKEMDELEEDAEALGKAVDKAVEDQGMEEARNKIAGQ